MQPLFIFYLIIDKALMPICHDLPQTGAILEQRIALLLTYRARLLHKIFNYIAKIVKKCT